MELEWNVLSVAFRWWLRRSSEAAAVQQHQHLHDGTVFTVSEPLRSVRWAKILQENVFLRLSNGMFYRQTGQTGAKKTYLDYFRWHYSIYMVKIQISCYLIYLFAWIKPVAENG